MAERVQFPQWRAENDPTKYPFAARATLTNGQRSLVEGSLLDAILYPIGGGARLRMSKVVVTHGTVTIHIGDQVEAELASGEFDLLSPPDSLPLVDAYGRPAGLLVSEATRLAIFGAWGVGTYEFTAEQAEFAATVCAPQPAVGVRGVLLDDGTVLTGEVWLVGDDGVVLRKEEVTVPAARCGGDSVTREVIRIDVVGDPLFRRRLCAPADLFATPNFIRTVTFKDQKQTVVCSPNVYGDIKVSVNNALAADTVLRIHPTPEGNKFEVVGSLLKSVR